MKIRPKDWIPQSYLKETLLLWAFLFRKEIGHCKIPFSFAKTHYLTTQLNYTFLFPIIFILLFYSLLYHEDFIFSLLNQWKNTDWTEW